MLLSSQFKEGNNELCSFKVWGCPIKILRRLKKSCPVFRKNRYAFAKCLIASSHKMAREIKHGIDRKGAFLHATSHEICILA